MAARSSYQNGAGPATQATAVTPSDATVVDFAAVYVGVGGDVSLTVAGANVTFVGVQAGTILPVQCTAVRSTGTTATSIVGLV
jgi:hypothetical protein